MPLAGQFVRASDLPNRVGCRLRRVANQSATSGVFTTISWDTEDQDTDGFVAVAADTITIPTGLGGLYAVTFHAVGTGITGAVGDVRIVPTSGITGMPADFLAAMDSGTPDRASIGVVTPLLAGDTFTCTVRHWTGSAINFTAWLAAYRVGA